MVGVEPAAVRSAPVNTSFDGRSLTLVELSSVEAVLTGGQDQKCAPNFGEASVHKIRSKKTNAGCSSNLPGFLNIMSGIGLFSHEINGTFSPPPTKAFSNPTISL